MWTYTYLYRCCFSNVSKTKNVFLGFLTFSLLDGYVWCTVQLSSRSHPQMYARCTQVEKEALALTWTYFQRTPSVLGLFYELITYLWLQVKETNPYLNCLLTRIYKPIYFTICYMPVSILYTWFYLSVLILLKTKCLLKVLSCSDTKLEETIKEKNKYVACNIVADGIEK